MCLVCLDLQEAGYTTSFLRGSMFTDMAPKRSLTVTTVNGAPYLCKESSSSQCLETCQPSRGPPRSTAMCHDSKENSFFSFSELNYQFPVSKPANKCIHSRIRTSGNFRTVRSHAKCIKQIVSLKQNNTLAH